MSKKSISAPIPADFSNISESNYDCVTLRPPEFSHTMNQTMSIDYSELTQKIKQWGKELGFQQVGISDIDLHQHEAQLQRWIDAGYHGGMDWMARHGMMRARPAELHPGTVRVISVRMNYLLLKLDSLKASKSPTPHTSAAIH